jgi:hypothetical protein
MPPTPDADTQQRLKLAVIEGEKVWAHFKALPKSQLPEQWAKLAMARLLELIHAVQPLIDPPAAVSQAPPGETAEPR